MSSLKRDISRLSARPSEFNSAVTLFELPSSSADANSESPRRSKRRKLEEAADEVAEVERTLAHDNDAPPPTPNSKESKSRTTSPKKPKQIKQILDIPHPPPAHWQETYDAIKVMRASIVAPVDTMGCDQAQFKETDPKVRLLKPSRASPANIHMNRVVGFQL